MIYLTPKLQKQIESRTRRYNPHYWKLRPASRRSSGYATVILNGVLASGEEVEVVRITVFSENAGDAAYHELNHYLASLPDWNGIAESDADTDGEDGDGEVLMSEDIDWSKLDG